MKRGEIVLWHGNEACAFGALAAGARFFAGYPITPSSEVAEVLSAELPKIGGKFIQMEDEIAAMAATLGASLTGRKALTATSGPGMSLKLENIGFAAMAEIPCVIINVMRGGPSTGLPTKTSQADVMQARWGTHGDHPVIAYLPNSVAECFHLTIEAFNAAEQYRMPVFVLLDEILGHMREPFTPPPNTKLRVFDRKEPKVYNLYDPREYLPYKHTEDDVPAMAHFGGEYRYHVTGLFHDQTGFPTNDAVEIDKKMRRLMRKVERYREKLESYEEYRVDDAQWIIVAYGSVSRSAVAAVDDLRAAGVPAGLFRPKTAWPFPESRVRELCGRVSGMLVAECNMGQMVLEVERLAGGSTKVEHLGRIDGELVTPDEIVGAVKKVMA